MKKGRQDRIAETLTNKLFAGLKQNKTAVNRKLAPK